MMTSMTYTNKQYERAKPELVSEALTKLLLFPERESECESCQPANKN